MKRSIEQRNQAYKKGLAQVLLKLFPESGLLVTDVLLDPSMKHGKVWLRGSTDLIQQVNTRKGEISQLLQRFVATRYMPSLEYVQDDRYLDRIDDLFSEIEQDEK